VVADVVFIVYMLYKYINYAFTVIAVNSGK